MEMIFQMFDDHLLVAVTCAMKEISYIKLSVFLLVFFVAFFDMARQVIVTEQDIDEEIGKEVKDKAEDYRKLKYYQVAKYFNKYY